ncbi:MAG: AbrB/MazE/SpoVT family DNA-binding domain-containing protein [Candidatus Thermoplasmatota archaeon]
MIEVEMKVGPKGQVVIPSVFRKNFNIRSGDKVIFESDGDRLIIKRAERGGVDKLKEIAESVGEVEVDSDKDYDKRMKERSG